MKKKQLILGLVVIAALAALLVWGRSRIHFDFGVFHTQLAQANWSKLALSLVCISSRLWLSQRPMGPIAETFQIRWAVFAPRYADHRLHCDSAHRSSRRPGSSLSCFEKDRSSTQFAACCVRCRAPLRCRVDGADLFVRHALGAVCGDHEGNQPFAPGIHARIPLTFFAAFAARYGGLVLTLLGALFLVAVRWAGSTVATIAERCFGLFSRKLGAAAGDKIRAFHSGLDTMRTLGEFGVTVGLSLSMWVLIATAYFEGCHAFVASPELASLTPSKCVLLMVASGGASIFQLPVIGWFTQIGIVAAAITGFFGANPEAATACAAGLLLTTFLGIVPVGLIWAQLDHVSLRKVTVESEHAEEAVTASESASAAE